MTVILKELVEILTTLLELPVKLSAFLDMDAKLCCVGMDVFLLSCVPYNSKNSRFQITYFFWEDKTVWLYHFLESYVLFGILWAIPSAVLWIPQLYSLHEIWCWECIVLFLIVWHLVHNSEFSILGVCIQKPFSRLYQSFLLVGQQSNKVCMWRMEVKIDKRQ